MIDLVMSQYWAVIYSFRNIMSLSEEEDRSERSDRRTNNKLVRTCKWMCPQYSSIFQKEKSRFKNRIART